MTSEGYRSASPGELCEQIHSKSVQLIDVRSDAEWNDESIPGAQHLFLGRLPEHLDDIAPDLPVVVHCASGARSAVAASILQAAGFGVINLAGGLTAWKREGLPTRSRRVEPVPLQPAL